MAELEPRRIVAPWAPDCEHPSSSFDRSLCADGWMHNHCEECGVCVDDVDDCTPGWAPKAVVL